jgi:MoaA/NifB/PqqE/SkfB family radical SAM enzyme
MSLVTRALAVLKKEGPTHLVERIISYGWKTFLMVRDPHEFVSESNHRVALNEYDKRVQTMEATPRDLTLETTTRCNLTCPMCWHAFPNAIKAADMPPELIESLREYIRRADSVQLHGNGEPLLSPSFWRALAYTRRTHRDGGCASINSNGCLLNDSTIEKLLEAGLQELNISLDAATPDTYRKIRGGHLDTVLDSIRALIRVRNNRGASFPKVSVHMTAMLANISELPNFVELAHALGVDKVAFWHLNEDDSHDAVDWVVERDGWVFNYQEQLLSRHPQLSNRMVQAALNRARELGVEMDTGDRKQLWFPEQIVPHTDAAGAYEKEVRCQRETPSQDEKPAAAKHTIECDAPWRWLVVGVGGTVKACCHMRGPVGDLNRQDPAQIWNGTEMRSLRRAIREHRLHPMCKGAACEYAHAHRH